MFFVWIVSSISWGMSPKTSNKNLRNRVVLLYSHSWPCWKTRFPPIDFRVKQKRPRNRSWQPQEVHITFIFSGRSVVAILLIVQRADRSHFFQEQYIYISITLLIDIQISKVAIFERRCISQTIIFMFGICLASIFTLHFGGVNQNVYEMYLQIGILILVAVSYHGPSILLQNQESA